MQLYSTDSLVIDIYNIRNLEYVNIYDVVIPNSSKMKVIPAMLISYDGGKTINLCSRDKYFNLFIKKVTEVYNNEKNNILEDSLTDPFRLRMNIKIDDHSKDILERGELIKINDLYRFYDEKKDCDHSLLFQSDEVKLLIPIIKYHINEVFKVTDKNINFEDNINGYKNNYMISGQINGIFKYFPFIFYKENDNKYVIEIGGLLDNSMIKMFINFLNDRIIINLNIDDYGIKSLFEYLISTDVIKEIKSIKKDNQLVHYLNRDLPVCENEYKQITDFDQNNNLKWFILPWKAIYGINNSIKEISETEKIIETYNMYVDSIEDSFIRKECFSRNYKRNDTITILGENVSLDEAIKNVIGVCLNKENGIYLIETSFLDIFHSNGYYNEKLKNKYFYHVFESCGIKEINKEKLINIDTSDEIITDSDILNDSLVLKLVRGK